jgi:hypothetical protein
MMFTNGLRCGINSTKIYYFHKKIFGELRDIREVSFKAFELMRSINDSEYNFDQGHFLRKYMFAGPKMNQLAMKFS